MTVGESQHIDDASDLIDQQNRNPLDRVLSFTIFPDEKAQRQARKTGTLRDIAVLIERTEADSKEALPFIKLAEFGDRRSGKNCLRTNTNLRAVHGIELDYDKGAVPPEEARRRFAEAGLAALIVPTPSDRKPGKGRRWRGFLPTSGPLPPEARAALVARANGVLGGVVDPASFTMSQAFYVGRETDGRPVQTFLTDGDYIDLRPDLDAGAIGRPEPQHTAAEGNADLPPDVILSALASIKNDTRFDRDTWIGVLAGVRKTLGEDGRKAARDWSDSWTGGVPDSANFDKAWDSLPEPRAGAGTILHHARRDGFNLAAAMLPHHGAKLDSAWSDDDLAEIMVEALVGPVPDDAEDDQPDVGASSAGGFIVLSLDDCAADMGQTPDYIVKGLIERGTVSVVYGQPNAGKTVFVAAMAHRVAKGESFFGRRVRQCPVVYLSYEGERGMRRRAGAMRREFGPAPDFHLVQRAGSLLPRDGKPGRMERAAADLIRKTGAGLVVIDTLAAAFAGVDENTMSQNGMGNVLSVCRRFAAMGCAVVLIHHPTKTGETMRGSGGLLGDVDLTIRVEAGDDRMALASTEKARDTAGGDRMAFLNRGVVIGTDDDGDSITTVICEERDVREIVPPGPKLKDRAKAAMTIWAELAESKGSVSESDWRAACMESPAVSDAEKSDSRRRAFQRVREELTGKNMLVFRDGRFFPGGFVPADPNDRFTDADV